MHPSQVLRAFFALALPGAVLADTLHYNISLNSQIRSAFAGSNGMTVSWNTYTQLDNPTVYYGLSPNALVQSASGGESVTYPSSLTYNNHVRLSGLLPGTKYYYMPQHLINSTSLVGPFSFKTTKLAGDQTPYSMAVVIDMGAMGSEGLTTTAGTGIAANNLLMPGEQNTIQSLTSSLDTFDFLMHPGDLAYADTWLTEVNGGFLNATTDLQGGLKAYESILDDFYDQLSNVSSKVPYMVGPGNHEANCVDYAYNCPEGQTNFTGFINHFRMPSGVASQAKNNPGVGNMWYSFDNGLVHYISLSMETDFPNNPDASFGNGPFGADGEQVAWLTADLAAVDRSKTPWIVVTGHRQWYSSGNGPCTACQSAFEVLFNEYEIDLYISGHYHVYERQVPISTGGVVDPKGLNDPVAPWYIVNGIGGHYGGLNPFNFVSPYQAYGLSILNATYGWSRLTFHNRTHMTHEFVNSSSNAVLDSATLFKSHNVAFPVLLPSSSSSSSSASSTSASSSKSSSSSTSATSISSSSTNSLSSTKLASTTTVTASGSSSKSSTSVTGATSAASTSVATTSTKTSGVTSAASSSATSSSVSLTTSTAYTTILSTILSCAPTVTNCPYGSVVTSTVALYTTVCPVSAASTTAPVSTTSAASYSTSTVYTTTVYTISSCPPVVTNCPYGSTTTEVKILYTTVCPVAAATGASSVAKPSSIAVGSASVRTGSSAVSGSASASKASIAGSSGAASSAAASTTKISTSGSTAMEPMHFAITGGVALVFTWLLL